MEKICSVLWEEIEFRRRSRRFNFSLPAWSARLTVIEPAICRINYNSSAYEDHIEPRNAIPLEFLEDL